jgi:AcrR family transcriptional regulator
VDCTTRYNDCTAWYNNGMGAATSDTRERLLSQAVDYVAAHGIAGVSLRSLAAALGTSHRMLIYHFGSREGLLVEIVRTVEARQRELLADVAQELGEDPKDVARAMWQRFTDPGLAAHERLFFEVYAQALQGSPHALPVLDGIIDSWIEPAVALARRRGRPAAAARTEARLGVAVVRGLLLDLLATGNRRAVDAAFERYLELTLPESA